jgi:hypothetical protein
MEAAKQPVKLVYKALLGMNFQQLLQKISFTPTHPDKAAVIRIVVEKLEDAQKKARDEYQEKIGKTLHAKDDKGEDIVEQTPQGPMNKIIEGKEEEYNKAVDEFEKNEIDVDLGGVVLNSAILSDIKLSANDIKLLGPLYVVQRGPGVPH